jgi:hypothetical protein
MKTKTLVVALLSGVAALACASASAQISSNSMQDHSLSHTQQNKAQPTSSSPLSSLLGAPQDDEETYLPDTRASGTTRGHASTRNTQTSRARATQDTELSPLLGAPEGYEDSYTSGLGDGPEQQTAESEAANYKLTPVELMLAPDLAERGNAPSEGRSLHRNAGGAPVAGERRDSLESGLATPVTPKPSSASQAQSRSSSTGSDIASTVYRSPW